MIPFITSVACVAVLFAVAAIVLGVIQYGKLTAMIPDSPFHPARAALDQGFGKALLRNIIILVVSLCWLIFGSGWFFA